MKAATLAERKRLSTTPLTGAMMHAAVHSVGDHEARGVEGTRERATAPTRGQDLAQVRSQTTACPVSPTRCPFGGACHACPLPVQAKLAVNRPGDRYEQEADRVAEEVAHASGPRVQSQTAGPPTPTYVPPIVQEVLRSPGRPLAANIRASMEPRFGQDLGRVHVHTDAKADQSARAVHAVAYTSGRDIVFSTGTYAPQTVRGQRLLAHELVHVVQQTEAVQRCSGYEPVPAIQREPADTTTETEQLTAPLTDREWQLLELWQSRGEVGIEPLTEDPNHNALVVADAIFCSRLVGSPAFNSPGEDPLLCVIPEVTRADPRVQRIAQHVAARGPIINWVRVSPDQRMLHVMELLVNQYGFPENGAAGLVGNLWSESGVLPSRVEGSAQATPMRARSFAGQWTDFTAEQVMNRNQATGQGPQRPGVGLAQWTSGNRRTGLFQHTFQGRQLGASILFSMDAQVDYLVAELQSSYPGVDQVLRGAGVSLNAASDEVVYSFETPQSITFVDPNGQRHRLPRTHADVQAVFAQRRAHAQRALQVFRAAHPQNQAGH